jgi:hypothetical protein
MVAMKNLRTNRPDRVRAAIRLAVLSLTLAAPMANAARPHGNGPAPMGGPAPAAKGAIGGPSAGHAGSVGGGASPAPAKPGVFGPKTAPAPVPGPARPVGQ